MQFSAPTRVVRDRETATLELGQYIYEFIALAVPLKKLHPRFKDEEEDEDEDLSTGKIVYSSEAEEDEKKKQTLFEMLVNIMAKLLVAVMVGPDEAEKIGKQQHATVEKKAA